MIAGDGAACQIDRTCGDRIERAAILGFVILDGAAVHIEGAACLVHTTPECPENSAAGLVAVVFGDLTAVHVEHAILVIQRDGSAAALAGDLTAGEFAAEHIQSAGIEVNAGAAPDVLRRALEGAAALTVAENKPGVISHFDLLFAVGGQCLAVQAQIQRPAVNDQIAVEGGIACQIDIGGIVVICDAARTVPRRIGYVGVAGVIACCDAAAADAVGVACLRGDALIGGLHRGHLGFIRVGCAIFRLLLIRGLGFRGLLQLLLFLLFLPFLRLCRAVLAIGEYRHRQQAQRQRQCQQDRK